MIVVDESPINIVCWRIADVPVPATSSEAKACLCCNQQVWVALETTAAVARMERTAAARVLCVQCAAPTFATTIAVLTPHSGYATGAAAEVSRRLGIPAGTPVIDIDRTNRARA